MWQIPFMSQVPEILFTERFEGFDSIIEESDKALALIWGKMVEEQEKSSLSLCLHN